MGLLAVLRIVRLPTLLPQSPRTLLDNGDWSDLPMLWPVLDIMLPALAGRRDFALAWLALVEHAIAHYPIDRFAVEAVAVLEALRADEVADETFRTKLGAAMQALDERAEQLSLETRGRLLRILDSLIDHGDRRAASLQRSERFRIAPWSANSSGVLP